MLITLFSIYVWIAWTLHLVLLGPIAVVLTLLSPTLGFRFVQLASRSVFFFAGIRVVVRGRERVDWSHAYVLMGNHQSLLDPFVLVIGVPQHMVGIEKRENLKIPVYGALARAWGNIPIHREDPQAAREAIALAEERLRTGHSIAILPEGTRSMTGFMGPFKKGGFHLALNTGAAIVPVTFNGVWERFRPGDWRVWPGTCEVVFDAPIPTAGYGKETMDALMERVRGAIAANFRGVAGRLEPGE